MDRFRLRFDCSIDLFWLSLVCSSDQRFIPFPSCSIVSRCESLRSSIWRRFDSRGISICSGFDSPVLSMVWPFDSYRSVTVSGFDSRVPSISSGFDSLVPSFVSPPESRLSSIVSGFDSLESPRSIALENVESLGHL
jgi:hypothetical protein